MFNTDDDYLCSLAEYLTLNSFDRKKLSTVSVFKSMSTFSMVACPITTLTI
jgi:hypothetical protein